MLLAEHPPTIPPLGTGSPHAVLLRLHGGTEDETLVPLDAGKHTIGSGPRCMVRIQEPGVQPLHCLIIVDADGPRVRRWAEDTLLNGSPFDEAELAPGDRLSLGSAELEVVGEFARGRRHEVATPTVKTPRPEVVAIELESPAEVVEEKLHLAQEVDEQVPERARSTDSTARARSRQLVATLRRHRDHYDELVDRVSGLEQRIDALLSERALSKVAEAAFPPLHVDDDSTVLNTGIDADLGAAFDEQVENSADDWLISARAALSRDRAPWMETPLPPAEEPIDPTELDNFDAEVIELREHLVASEKQVAEVKAQAAALEQQLADSRRMLQHFAEERAAWQSQLSETEGRLSEYVERIQELANLLEEARERPVEAPVAVESTVGAVAEAAPQLSRHDNLSWGGSEDASGGSDDGEAVANESAPSEMGWAIEEGETTVERAAVDSAEQETIVEESAPADVDTALAHLREMSVWRQEPVVNGAAPAESPTSDLVSTDTVNEDSLVEATPVEGTPDSHAAAPTVPTSYIDRFSHLFEEDETASADELNKSSSEAADQDFGHSVGESAHVSSQASAPAAGQEDEESVEQYMAKLLERMRGSQDERPNSASDKSVRDVVRSDNERSGEGSTNVEPPAPKAPAKAPRPRMPAAELSTDMDMLRALANQSARHAIGVHTARTLRRNSFTRLITAVLAATTSLYFLLESAGWDSYEFAIACVAALVAVAWGRLTYTALVKAARVGAFDDLDEDFIAIDGSKLPLPIDVSRQND
jgi:hypothetical protein